MTLGWLSTDSACATCPAAQLSDWTGDLAVPKVSWFPGFFNPQSFLTAVLQVTVYPLTVTVYPHRRAAGASRPASQPASQPTVGPTNPKPWV